MDTFGSVKAWQSQFLSWGCIFFKPIYQSEFYVRRVFRTFVCSYSGPLGFYLEYRHSIRLIHSVTLKHECLAFQLRTQLYVYSDCSWSRLLLLHLLGTNRDPSPLPIQRSVCRQHVTRLYHFYLRPKYVVSSIHLTPNGRPLARILTEPRSCPCIPD